MHSTPLLALPLLFATACAGTRGDGQVSSAARELAAFHAVETHGALRVEITVGSPQRVEVKTDKNLLENVKTKVENGTLVIHTEGSIEPTDGVTVIVVATALDAIDTSGASDISARELTGAKLDIDGSGASNVHLAGAVGALTLDLSGASEIDAGGLIAGTVVVEASGASTVIVHATDAVDIDASGASHVTQRGPGRIRRAESSGASTIETSSTAR